DTRAALDAIARLGENPWFQLGDQDIATHILRTQRLRAGETLAEITAGFATALGIATTLLPMSNDPVRTHIRTAEGWLDFQSYFVGRRHADDVLGVRFDGIESANPAGGVV